MPEHRNGFSLASMNIYHRWYCGSTGWRRRLHDGLLPWVFDGHDLGADVLEIGPGPGIVTDWLSARVPRLTSVEIDAKLAQKLKARVDPSAVTVIEADATDLRLPDDSFDSAISLTMLHHVPSPGLQDRLLHEAHRMLKPGGLFLGLDSTLTLRWRLIHLFDTCVPVDPAGFRERLQAAGFEDVRVDVAPGRFRFSASKP